MPVFEKWISMYVSIGCIRELIYSSFNFEMFGRTITEKMGQAEKNAFEFRFMYNSYI